MVILSEWSLDCEELLCAYTGRQGSHLWTSSGLISWELKVEHVSHVALYLLRTREGDFLGGAEYGPMIAVAVDQRA